MLYRHDIRLFQHSSRVAELCLQIGEQLRLSENDLRNVVKAAILHDIGKTRIPANILNTPGPLSKEQWGKVKMHPIWGSEIFNEDATIQKGIITHHENYDGTGYPFGLKNEDIHIIGRIIAIADSIDAMTTIRPYRKPISMSQAINEVQKYSGVKYDPYVVKSLYNISFVRKAQAR
jgi:HD-GYP domain-containing protein (c-di-GMP phosphodiesterase class II)